ncbi:hypothetical protein ACHAPN_000477 [Verticillium nonalfalfae]
MAPSFLSAAESALLFSAAVQAKSYQLSDTYDSTNFLDKFSLFESDHSTGNYNDVDPTSGYVSYKGRAEAEELGILKTVGDEFFLGVDAKTKLDPTGIGRSSVRLESKAKYNKGLYIADFTHFPKPTCGTWPAFWTVGQAWPSGGEIDIYEAWNLDAASRIVMHTDAKVGQCGIDGEGMTADMGKPNCAGDAPGQGSGEGCAGLDPSAPYASDKGGVYALEWTDDSIKIWAFTHDNVPADLAENPNPETWGLPRFASAACEVGKVFDDAQIIMNINFCGVAGHEGHWDQCAETTKQTSCQAYIAENPEALKDSYFQVRSIKVYTPGDEKTEYAPPAIESEAAEPTVTSVVVSSPAPEKPQYTDLPEGEEVPSTPVEPEVPVESDFYEQPGTPSIPVEPEVPVESEIYEQPPETPEQPVVSEPVSVEKPIASASASIPEQPVASEPVSAPEQPVASETPSASEQPAQSASVSVPDYPIETEPISIVPSESVLPVPTSVPITSGERLTTLTISETRVTTITSCPPEAAAECPGKVGEVVTEVIAVTTTVCPVTDVPTVVTVSKTIVNTVTSCAPDVPDCPGAPSTTIQEEVITTTTAIPVLESSVPVPVPEPTPEVPTPAEPTPEVPAPEQPTPEVPVPEEPGKPEEPEYPTPEEPTPEEPTPEEPTSQVPQVPVESEKPTPEEPTPEEPAPEEPTSQVPEVPVSEAPTPTITSERLTTLTISETRISTITSCPPEAAADCPGKLGSTITEVVGVTTTVCPVIDVATTVVVSKTIVNTITSCAPEVTNCPVGQPSTTIEEEIITTTTPVVVFEPTGEPTPEEPKPEEPTPEQPIPEQPTPVEPTPEQPTPEEPVTPGEPTPVVPVTPEQPTPEYPAPEEPIPETPVPEQPTPESPTPEQPTPEQPTPEQPIPEQPTPESPTPEQPTPEQPVPEQPTPEEPITPGQPTPDYPAPEEPVPQPPSPTASQVVPPPPAIPTFTSIINGTQTAPVTFPTSTDIPVEVDAANKLGSGGLTLLVGTVLGVIAFVL